MATGIQSLIDRVSTKPSSIFLVDGVGALLSAFLLGGLLATFYEVVGMPSSILYLLGGLAFLFAVYSLTCSYLGLPHWPYLLLIIIANTLYSFLTVALMFIHSSLSSLGLLYFILELLIISVLIYLEIQVLLKK